MKHITIGILAHVDAGKTTLSEGLLYTAGSIRQLGRVDDQNAFLDNNHMERDRGITIFSKPARFALQDGTVTLLDTPGHVDFSAEMESLLREYEAFCTAETERYDRRKQTKDDYVFRRKGMKLPMTPSTFTWRFKKILRANDLPDDLNVHSLRHTAASLFVASGTDVGTVAGLLGHSQPSTTLDIYTHAFDKNKKAASQIMQSSLEI